MIYDIIYTRSELVAKLRCSLGFDCRVKFHKDAQSSRENLQVICFLVSYGFENGNDSDSTDEFLVGAFYFSSVF